MTFLLQSFVIPTGSMENNLLIGDHLLVDKISYSRSISPIDRLVFPQKEIKRGMIVTFKSPAEMEKEYVKRINKLIAPFLQDYEKDFLNAFQKNTRNSLVSDLSGFIPDLFWFAFWFIILLAWLQKG